ncbi:MAG: hypothetical protein ACNYNX_06355 [Leucobacter sp.]
MQGSEIEAQQAAVKPRTDGLGRVLITVYLILALAATMRAVFQIIAKFDEAPLAYSLSLVSGIVYIVATVALIRRRGAWRVVAWVALIFEFAGVIIVGALSFIAPDLFAHDSVWSHFGSGYLFIPLVLPVLGMIWLRRDRVRQAERAAAEAGATATSSEETR